MDHPKNPAAADPSSSSSTSRFDKLEETLETFQENARQIAVIAADFQPKSQESLNQKLQTLVSGLQELDSMKHSVTDVHIPVELLELLDAGQNPHLYTKQMIERTHERNKAVNGKIELYHKLKAHLLKELGDEMPAATLAYRTHREGGRQGQQPGNASSATAGGGGGAAPVKSEAMES